MPARLQRKRTAGWRASDACTNPNGYVFVGRGTRWGNPFAIGHRYVSRTAFHDSPYPERDDRPLGTYEHPAWSPWPAWTEVVGEVRDRAHAVELFRDHIAYNDDLWDPEVILRELGGKDLMCWCPPPAPDQPDHCHARVEIDLANDLLLRDQFGARLTGMLTVPEQNTAVDAYVLIQAMEGPHTARAWMIGLNPHLDDQPPILAIRDGRGRDVLVAARAHLEGVYA